MDDEVGGPAGLECSNILEQRLYVRVALGRRPAADTRYPNAQVEAISGLQESAQQPAAEESRPSGDEDPALA
jgi:hypothetical protein